MIMARTWMSQSMKNVCHMLRLCLCGQIWSDVVEPRRQPVPLQIVHDHSKGVLSYDHFGCLENIPPYLSSSEMAFSCGTSLLIPGSQ